MSERLRGVIGMVIGACAAYLFVYLPWTMAAQHSGFVYMTAMGAMLAPLALGFGLLYIILGPTATELFGTRARPKPAVYLFGIVFSAPGFAFYFWLRLSLQGTGYHFSMNLPSPGDKPPATVAAPRDVGEALAWVLDDNDIDNRQSRGAEWLAQAPVDPACRPEVAAALERLTAYPQHKEAAIRGLAAWAGPENGPRLLKEMEYYDKAGMEGAEDEGYVSDALLRIQYAPAAALFARHLTLHFSRAPFAGAAARRLAALGPIAEREVLKYMDHPDRDVRDQVAGLLRQYGTKPEDRFNQALADLKSGDAGYRRVACDALAATPVDEARRAEAAQALQAVLPEPADALGQRLAAAAAANALKTWGTRDNAQALIAEMDRNDSNTKAACMGALAKIKDERVAAAVAAHLTDFYGNADAVSALREMGPVALNAVAAYVNHANPNAQAAAQRLLREYGAAADVTFNIMMADVSAKGPDPTATDRDQRVRAVEWLAAQPADDAHQKQVARALDGLLAPGASNDLTGQVRGAAARAEVVWADKDSVPTLIKGLESNDAAPACMRALGRIKDERAVDPLLLQTAAGKLYVAEAQKALTAMGPVVETALDKELTDPTKSAANKVVVCQLLGLQIGTKASIPALTAACADPDARVKATARAALAVVQKRNP